MHFLILLYTIYFILKLVCSDSIKDNLIETVLVRAHNQLRREVQPQASNMKELVWSKSLQLLADYKVQDCQSSSLNLEYNGVTYGYTSRLIQGISHPNMNSFLTSVEEWFDSSRYYNMYDNECRNNPRTCENYIQAAWANSSEIGCAYNYCTSRNSESDNYGILILCLYYAAMDGDLPYMSGEKCSLCPDSNPHCNQGLCSSVTATESPSFMPYVSKCVQCKCMYSLIVMLFILLILV